MDERERALIINPIVPESVQHNARTLSNIRALTASLFGVAAGILGLESYAGFAFYVLGAAAVGLLVWALKVQRGPVSNSSGSGGGGGGSRRASGGSAYFWSPLQDLWLGEVVGNLMGFVLTWTLFYGLVRA